MKHIIKTALIVCLFGISTHCRAAVDPYTLINPAQEKVRIVLKQLHATYNWMDVIYAARERYYLSGIGLEYLRQLRLHSTLHKEALALMHKLERILEKLHVPDLGQKEFEKIQCEAQPLLQIPIFSHKSTSCAVA